MPNSTQRRLPKGAKREASVRIVAGRFRGRRLPVLEVDGLRPTPDRVRETLFNWLAPDIVGATVLDLFAGTGALGLEATSRGASQVTVIERDKHAADHLRRWCRDWGIEAQCSVHQAEAITWLRSCQAKFDIVFVDPPYHAGLYQAAFDALEGRLMADARVYVESDSRSPQPRVPDTWQELRGKVAGDVRYHVFAVP